MNNVLGLGNANFKALLGYSAFATAGTYSGVLQGYHATVHCKDVLWVGTARTLCCWALQACSARRVGTT